MPEELGRFGTVISLDLTAHEILGEIEVELASNEIRRIIEYAFEKLPDKTDYQKKCKDSVCGWLFNKHIEITFSPVLNKEVLKEVKALKL